MIDGSRSNWPCSLVLDHHVLALDVAGFVEAFAERSVRGVLGRPVADEADDRHRWLLCTHRERPRRCRAAEKRDERAALHLRGHSITSSARPISGSGIVRPSVFAVLRLMILSTFVACWTGRSAGFSPFRIRPV